MRKVPDMMFQPGDVQSVWTVWSRLLPAVGDLSGLPVLQPVRVLRH